MESEPGPPRLCKDLVPSLRACRGESDRDLNVRRPGGVDLSETVVENVSFSYNNRRLRDRRRNDRAHWDRPHYRDRHPSVRRVTSSSRAAGGSTGQGRGRGHGDLQAGRSRGSGPILGLLALRRHENYVEDLTLLESDPRDVGRSKRFRGIPGSLFAFAAQLSFEIGGEGFIAIDARTELIEHYPRVRPRETMEQPEDDPHHRSRREADRTVWREATP